MVHDPSGHFHVNRLVNLQYERVTSRETKEIDVAMTMHFNVLICDMIFACVDISHSIVLSNHCIHKEFERATTRVR